MTPDKWKKKKSMKSVGGTLVHCRLTPAQQAPLMKLLVNTYVQTNHKNDL